jgi:hypothetical protein
MIITSTMPSTVSPRLAFLVSGLVLLLSACNGDSTGSSNTTASTPTPRSTATTTPVATATGQPTATRTPITGARVVGLVVVNQSVSLTANDRLAAPPAAWTEDAGNAAFDKALGFADWAVVEDDSINGTTGEDGQFEIGGLDAGRYTLLVTKSLDGNLLSARVPFAVGDDGATVVAEVSWGLVRSVSTYTDDGVTVREVRDPAGRYLITRNGKIAELGDASFSISDPDGDGSFDAVPCVDTLWSCGTDRACGDERVCGCVSSCPFCEDCGAFACQPPGVFPPPYRCNATGGCDRPGDRCVCVSSCPECDDCAFSACVADCQSVEITALNISGHTELIVGEQGVPMYAVAMLSNGRSVDVTTLVDWASSNPDVATVDAFGTISTHSVGTTTLSGTLGDIVSNDWPLNVSARPPLQRIYLQNVGCYYPLGDPAIKPGDRPPVLDAAPIRDDVWWPVCNQVVRIGNTIQFRAFGEFGNGTYYQDITDEVTWQLAPAGVGSIVAGLFTAQAEGTTALTASLSGVTSDASEIRVVTEATVTMLSIYADQGVPILREVPGVVDGSAAGLRPDQCFDCGYTIPILRGDELQFHATAHYDTGEWQDVTDDVTWRSSDPAIASIDADGTMLAVAVGTAVIDATFEAVSSNTVNAQVVAAATLQYLYLQPEGTSRVVVKGGQLFFHALGNYDVLFQRDVTDEATWGSSNDAIGTFVTPGVFTGRAAGSVQVWAELDGKRTELMNLEVYETSDVTYCDPDNVNRGVWSDDFNRVILESDCDTYTRPGLVTLRYTVTETQFHGGIFDPCLDLYIYRGDEKIRTLREEGCGEPFLARGAPEFDAALPIYQLRAFWDLKDEGGQVVTPGTYTVFGRFYLYYDPIVTIDISVQ